MNARSRRLALLGAGLLTGLVVVAVTAPWIAPFDPRLRTGLPYERPSATHLLGTNDIGQDLFSALLHGARVSLLVGVVAALTATVIGTAVGVSAGYARGWLDSLLMRWVDVVLALPVLPLTIVVGVFAGPGLRTQILVISAVLWAGMARELRAQVLSLRERDHMQALRAMGAPARHVLPRHVLPAVGPLVLPQLVLATRTAILLEASLAFLGLGDITAPSWGTVLSLAHARSAFLTDTWIWWVIPPGAAIAVTVLAFALLGYALEEQAQPALRDQSVVPRPEPSRPVTDAAVPADALPLAMHGLCVRYGDDGRGVQDVTLSVAPGEIFGLVGESGSGKSTVVGAAAGLLPPAARIVAGSVRVCGLDLAALAPRELRSVRGDRVALVPQEAMSSLNPVLTVGFQLREAVRAHRQLVRPLLRRRATELLELVGLDPARARDHPHQLSGGMRQRVVIAIALAADPVLVVADEPTSGLDVLAQQEVLDLLERLRAQLGLAMLVVSHDLPVLEQVADRIAVLHEGRLVECGTTAQVLDAPEHDYTRLLVRAAPRLRPTGVLR